MRLLLVATLALLAPVAAAHLETFSEAKALVLGPYNGLVEPYPAPAYENSQVTIRAIFSRTATGAYVNNVTASVDVRFPDGTNQTKPLSPDGYGYYVALFAVRQQGEHIARVTIEDAEGSYSNETSLTVYRETGVRIGPSDAALADPLVGHEYPIGIAVTDVLTGKPAENVTDLTVRIEHWTDDHKTMLGSEDVRLHSTAAGLFTATHTFDEKGMYHLRFASAAGGFNYDDVPLLHVYANDPPPGMEPKKESPFPALVGVVAALAVAALARRR